MCVYFVANMCAGRFGLGWAHNAFIFACHMFMPCTCTFKFLYLLYYILLVLFWMSPSLPLSLFLTLVATWHLDVNSFRPGTLFILKHLLLLLLLTPLPLTSGSMMRRPNRTSLRTFHNAAFIRNTKSFCQIFLTLTYPLSSIVGVGSHCVASWSRALPWSYRSFTPICTDLILQYLISSLVFKVHIS